MSELRHPGRRISGLLGFHRMARISDVLNRVTGGRVGLYSTAEHYSRAHTPKVLRYYQYEATAPITCPVCGWRGSGEDADRGMFAELFDLSCPRCDQMLLVVGYPTLGEIEQAARDGNAEARSELTRIREAKQGRRPA